MKKDLEEVEVKGWGIGAKFSGANITCVVTLMLLGAGGMYGFYLHNADTRISMEAIVRAQEAVRAELTAGRETQEGMMYILSLKQEEREKLNLTRPKKIMDMQR